MPKSKIVVGMPLYGKAWTLPSSARNGKTPGPGMFAQGVDQVGWISIILYSITQKMLKADGSIRLPHLAWVFGFGWRWVAYGWEHRFANLWLELCPFTY